ncbi:TPA: hypothetical protein ACS508_002347 [Salmonella enterica]
MKSGTAARHPKKGKSGGYPNAEREIPQSSVFSTARICHESGLKDEP